MSARNGAGEYRPNGVPSTLLAPPCPPPLRARLAALAARMERTAPEAPRE